MRSHRATAALITVGLVIAGCGGPGSENGETAAVDSLSDTSATTADQTGADAERPAAGEPLVVAVDDDPAEPAGASDTATTTRTGSSASTTSQATTTPATETTSTTAAPTTITAPTTSAQSTAASTTGAATVETRPEILNLALPKFGGGNFDPNSVAGRNVILWFWGAH